MSNLLELLKHNDKRRIKLLELLIQSRGRLSYKELTEKLSISSRILRDDIAFIKENYSYLTIKTSKQKIRLVLNQPTGIKETFREIIHSNLAFQVLELLFFDETLSISQLADRFYTSASTMYRIIDSINSYFKEDFDCYIQTNPCKFVGNEKNIRSFYKTYFTEAYTVFDWPFKDYDEESVNKKFNKILSLINAEYELGFAYYEFIKTNIMVNLYRYKQGHLIDSTDNVNSVFNTIFSVGDIWEKTADKEDSIQFTEEYIYQVFCPYIKKEVVYNRDQLNELRKKDELIDEALTFLTLNIEMLAQQRGILVNTEHLILIFYGMLVIEDDDPKAHYIIYNHHQYLAHTIEQLFPEFYSHLYEAITSVRSILGLPLDKDKLNRLICAIFTNWENLLIQLVNQVRDISIIIMSDQHISHANMIKSSLEFALGSYIHIDVYDQTHISEKILMELNYDIIISTFTLPPVENKEIVIIEHFPTPQDIVRIESVIMKIYSQIIGSNF